MKRVDGLLYLALSLVDVCATALFQEKCLYKEFHPSWRHEEPSSKKKNLTKPEGVYLAQKKICSTSKLFFETLAMFIMIIQLFNSVNNS